jgi:N-acetyl-anhydromuramyl-L-alanine amidase AmpD
MPSLKKKFIILHHSATLSSRTTFEAINNYHKQKWDLKSALGFYIGYHYFINAQGKIYQGRKDEEVGAHCREEKKNYDSIGICLAGNFDKEAPSRAQLESLKKLTAELIIKHKIIKNNLKFHRDYATHKTCPGKNIKDNFWGKLIN